MTNSPFCGKTVFTTVCKLCEDINGTVARDKKVVKMRTFINAYREQSRDMKDDNFYPILRLLLPQLDHERTAYGIKEYTLAKIYIRILCLSKQSKDAQRLMNYRAPKIAGDGAGDFADVAYFILRPRCQEVCNLTVDQVNESLNNIAAKHLSRDPRGVDEELQSLLLSMSALEQKWFIRILLKEMKLGLPHSKILSLFHPDAKDLYDVSNDLYKICITLKDASIRLHEIEIGLFQPFKPMLSYRCDVQNVEKELPSLDYYFVENKFDGERFQLHFNNGEYKYFSRNGYDYTDTYGCNTSHGILSPYLGKQLSANVKNCILDGEMMCWNTRMKSFTTKGKNIDVKLLRVGNVHQACFCVFDILFYNDVVLTNKPLTERIAILDKVLKSEEGIVVNVSRDKVTNGKQIMGLLNKAIDNSEEGIVVKDPNSVYKPNSRKAGWYKIKPEYTAGLMVELDLLILGGYYGEGRRRGIISHFLLGLAVSLDKLGEEPKVFQSVSRVSGCRKEELAELTEKLRSYWRPVKHNKTPNSVQWTKEKPDLWIEPQNSCILQVIATEVTRSDAFKVGYTLRFPRIQRVRYDKPWYDCLSVTEFDRIRQAGCGKLCASHATNLDSSPQKKPTSRLKHAPTLGEEFKPCNLSNVSQRSSFMEGKEICVLTGSDDKSKNEIEKLIIENGGTIVQNPRKEETFCVIAKDDRNIRVKNIMKLNRTDVIKVDWIMKCFERNIFITPAESEFISMTASTAADILKCSEADDPECNSTDIVKCSDNLSVINARIEHEGSTKDLKCGMIFKNCKAHFADPFELSDYEAKNVLKSTFESNGGIIQESIDETTTHIIVCSRMKQSKLEELLKDYTGIYIVTEKWISESYLKRNHLEELLYKPLFDATKLEQLNTSNVSFNSYQEGNGSIEGMNHDLNNLPINIRVSKSTMFYNISVQQECITSVEQCEDENLNFIRKPFKDGSEDIWSAETDCDEDESDTFESVNTECLNAENQNLPDMLDIPVGNDTQECVIPQRVKNSKSSEVPNERKRTADPISENIIAKLKHCENSNYNAVVTDQQETQKSIFSSFDGSCNKRNNIECYKLENRNSHNDTVSKNSELSNHRMLISSHIPDNDTVSEINETGLEQDSSRSDGVTKILEDVFSWLL